jgi:iron-sulfur cluster repair protein YtfE (RIC family)
MNAIELLKQQHQNVLNVLKDMTENGNMDPDELRLLADELVAHMVIEEHIFYPRIRKLMRETIDESFEEHTVARFALARAMMAAGEEQKTRLKVLKELLEHHIEEEEEEMFPHVASRIAADELELLGRRMLLAFERAAEKGFEAFFPGDGAVARPRAPSPRAGLAKASRTRTKAPARGSSSARGMVSR